MLDRKFNRRDRQSASYFPMQTIFDRIRKFSRHLGFSTNAFIVSLFLWGCQRNLTECSYGKGGAYWTISLCLTSFVIPTHKLIDSVRVWRRRSVVVTTDCAVMRCWCEAYCIRAIERPSIPESSWSRNHIFPTCILKWSRY